ncbi:MAG: lytic transglycosylase domain-containing protein [Clostridia bacterium]|nr:lytic transglycosylase domain-containing protein [Clostridia bacterium]
MNLDPNLIFAVIKAESDFDPNVVSKSGACGLMQIMPATAKYMIEQYDLNCSLDDLFLPKVNIEIGSQYLRYLLDKYKNLDDVIVAYNAGETTMMNWKKNNQSIQYAETRHYLKRVKRNITFYQRKKSLFV